MVITTEVYYISQIYNSISDISAQVSGISTPTDFTFTKNSNFTTYFKNETIVTKLFLNHLAIITIKATINSTLSTSEIIIGRVDVKPRILSTGSFMYGTDSRVAGGCCVDTNKDVFIHSNIAYAVNNDITLTIVFYVQ